MPTPALESSPYPKGWLPATSPVEAALVAALGAARGGAYSGGAAAVLFVVSFWGRIDWSVQLLVQSLFATLACIGGGMLVGFMALPVGLAAIALAWFARIELSRAWAASLVGGWAGFIYATLIVQLGPFPAAYGYLFISAAVLFGQVGSARAVNRFYAHLKEGSDLGLPRFDLRQLFALMTICAVIAGLFSAVGTPAEYYALTTAAAFQQAATIYIARWTMRSRAARTAKNRAAD